MKRQSLFVWGISILSILILAALILVNKQQSFSFYESKDAHKKEMIALNQPTELLKINNSESSSELLTFPLADESLAQLFRTSKEMYINASSLNLRAGPSTNFDLIKTLFRNDPVTVGSTITFDQFDYDEAEVEWVAIQSDDAIGFVNPNYLVEEPTEVTDEQETETNDDDQALSSSQSSSSENTTSTTNEKPNASESSNNTTDKETNDTQSDSDDSTTEEKDETPVVTTKTVTETEVIYHKVIEIANPDLTEGSIELVTEGTNGILTITYKETYEDNRLIKTEEVKREITKDVKDEVVHVGTKPASTNK